MVMEQNTMDIVIAILGSGALSALISGIFGLIQSRKSRQKEIEAELKALKLQLATAEKDALRTQLLLMIKDFPDEQTDILRLAEHYFKNLNGNWVLTDIFASWADEKQIQLPAWAKKEITK